MIFVTVGEQLPFDRLIRTVDEWATVSDKEVIAQIGSTHLKPKNITYKNHFEISEFNKIFLSAELVIAHAGMGTILTALELRKPVIVMPRQAALGEHRNDHQFATAKKIVQFDCIDVAFDENELIKKLNGLNNAVVLSNNNNNTTGKISLLIEAIKNFID